MQMLNGDNVDRTYWKTHSVTIPKMAYVQNCISRLILAYAILNFHHNIDQLTLFLDFLPEIALGDGPKIHVYRLRLNR